MEINSERIHSACFSHPLVIVRVSIVEIEGLIKVREVRFLKEPDSSNSSTIPAITRIGQRITYFLDGAEDDFSDCNLDMSWCSSFQQKVLQVARKIPHGQTITYGQLAALADNKKAVRAAATVMRKNRFPIIIPCHRVVRSSGDTGGFYGKLDGEMVELKKRLIEIEKSVMGTKRRD